MGGVFRIRGPSLFFPPTGRVGTVMALVSMFFVSTLAGIDPEVIRKVSTFELDQTGQKPGLFGACGFWPRA